MKQDQAGFKQHLGRHHISVFRRVTCAYYIWEYTMEYDWDILGLYGDIMGYCLFFPMENPIVGNYIYIYYIYIWLLEQIQVFE